MAEELPRLACCTASQWCSTIHICNQSVNLMDCDRSS
uniref:Uncharacterized protein n=1 Tax=Anguilla anguilla TaxID=7936 RepID=A0A0E9RIB7_ANGAN